MLTVAIEVGIAIAIANTGAEEKGGSMFVVHNVKERVERSGDEGGKLKMERNQEG